MTHSGLFEDIQLPGDAKAPKLSIILPTIRFDAVAKQTILTVAALGSDDVNVLIGDNSENEEKWAFLRQVEATNRNVTAFCRPTNVGEAENFRLLCANTEDDYLCYVSDDDVCSVDYFRAGFETLKQDPTCATASGLMLVLAPKAGGQVDMFAAPSNMFATPAERIAQYKGYNTIIWSVFRRRFIQPFFDYTSDRPFIASYDDQIFAHSLLAQGTYRICHDRPLYVWMNSNWADEATAFKRSAGFYVRAGLPEQFQLLHLMSWAIETTHYFQSKYCPDSLSSTEAKAIADMLYDRLFNQQFRPFVANNLQGLDALFRHSPTGGQAILNLLRVPCDSIHWILEQYIAILDAFNPDLAMRYKRFVDTSF